MADSFVVATPDGVPCGQDDEITKTLRQTLDLWRAIGVKEIAIRVGTTPIDETPLEVARFCFTGPFTYASWSAPTAQSGRADPARIGGAGGAHERHRRRGRYGRG